MTRHLTLRSRFVAFGIICLIPLLIVVIFFLDRSGDRSNQEILTSEATLSSLVTQSLTNYINLHFQTIDRLASVPAIQSQEDIDEVSRILGEARTLRPDMSGVFLVNADGQVIAQSGTDSKLVLPYLNNQIESTLATGQHGVSRRIDIDDDTHVLVLLAPVTAITQTSTSSSTTSNQTTPGATSTDREQFAPTGTPSTAVGTLPPGSVLGVIGSVIQVDNLNQQVFPVLRTRTEISILSPDQVITSSGDLRQNEVAFLELIDSKHVRASDSGTDVFTLTSPSGTKRIATYSPVPIDAADWGVVVSNPRTGAYGNQLWVEGSLLLLMAGLALISIALAVGEYTSRPLRDIADDALKLQDDPTHAVRVQAHGTDEIRGLSASLAQISERLRDQSKGLEHIQTERQRQTTQMRELLRRTLRLQEDERRRIAGEIHDAVSPLITGALYQARALQMSNGSTSHEQLAESLRSVDGLLERASEELHGVIFDLRPPDLDDLGVVAALEVYISTIQRTGLEARLEVVNELPPQTPEVRLGIYRIVQEALHNVIRHANADEAVVRIEFTEDNDLLRVTIRDNGAGFDPETAGRPTSLGMLSMRERAAAIGANLSIISRPGGGTAIVLERTDTGNVMSDELLDELMRHQHEDDEVAETDRSTDNTASDDASTPTDVVGGASSERGNDS
ncbi:MAG TPA: ATP-binding protein [Thermomicrobiales bacterium]|nr:ATP-binding protein [Thermomicrobiales bacterium]